MLIAILIVVALLFGGFQKGTKAGLGPAPAHVSGPAQAAAVTGRLM